MANGQNRKLARLREKAEALLNELEVDISSVGAEQVKSLVHELRVHQIELSMQNEELLQAQREVERSRDRYSQLYHSAPVGYLSLDGAGVILQANRTFAAMVGLGPESLYRRPLVNSLHEADQPVFLARYRAFFHNPTGKTMELRLKAPDGHIFVKLHGRSEKLNPPGGGAPKDSLLLAVTDISEQKHWEAALSRQADFLETLMDALPSPVFYQDEHGRCQGCNRAFEALAGKTRQDVLGREVWGLWKEQPNLQFRQRARLMMADQAVTVFDLDLPRPSRGRHSLLVYKSAYCDRDGAVAGQVGVLVDITERKAMESRLLRESGLNSALAQLAQVLLSSSGLAEVSGLVLGKAKALTSSALGLVGYMDRETGQLVYSRASRMAADKDLDPESRAKLEQEEAMLDWALRLGQPLLSNQAWQDFRHQAMPVGNPNLERLLAVPVLVGERMSGMLALANPQRDFTTDDLAAVERLASMYGLAIQRMWTEQDLLKSKEAAEAGNVAKSQFLATISHEIRTPMNAIMGFAHLAMNKAQDPQQREFLEIINSSSTHLLALVNEILDLSKIESGTLQLEQQGFRLRETLEEVIKAQEPKAVAKSLDLERKFASNITDYVLGDKLRLKQVLINLLDNAIKFTEQGGIKLVVSALPGPADEARLEFAVSDSGLGIPQDRQKDIFKPFVQVDASNSRRFAGTGLGLAICQRLVSAMDGQLWVESQPGLGSTFRFNVRLRAGSLESQPRADQDPPPAVSAAPKESLRILLAEDNRINQKVATALLQKRGHQVIIAEDGEQALRALANEPVDLILMDVEMPGLDGLETTRLIREQESLLGDQSHTPIIAMTAHAMQGDRERFLQAGMDDYISKPIDPPTFFETIQRVVARLAR